MQQEMCKNPVFIVFFVSWFGTPVVVCDTDLTLMSTGAWLYFNLLCLCWKVLSSEVPDDIKPRLVICLRQTEIQKHSAEEVLRVLLMYSTASESFRWLAETNFFLLKTFTGSHICPQQMTSRWRI